MGKVTCGRDVRNGLEKVSDVVCDEVCTRSEMQIIKGR